MHACMHACVNAYMHVCLCLWDNCCRVCRLADSAQITEIVNAGVIPQARWAWWTEPHEEQLVRVLIPCRLENEERRKTNDEVDKTNIPSFLRSIIHIFNRSFACCLKPAFTVFNRLAFIRHSAIISNFVSTVVLRPQMISNVGLWQRTSPNLGTWCRSFFWALVNEGGPLRLALKSRAYDYDYSVPGPLEIFDSKRLRKSFCYRSVEWIIPHKIARHTLLM